MRRPIPSLLFILLVVEAAGCVGTVRDELGRVHDAHYVAEQTGLLLTDQPLLVPFVPIGWIGCAIEAVPENGPVHFAGTITDEHGNPLKHVSLHIVQAKLVSFDLDDDRPLFSESSGTTCVDGSFDVNLPDVHTLKLRFTKPGYQPRDYHLEFVQLGGLRREGGEGIHWDVPAKAATIVYGQGALTRTGVQVVMRSAASGPD